MYFMSEQNPEEGTEVNVNEYNTYIALFQLMSNFKTRKTRIQLSCTYLSDQTRFSIMKKDIDIRTGATKHRFAFLAAILPEF